jgi:hypothetical protein
MKKTVSKLKDLKQHFTNYLAQIRSWGGNFGG